MLPRVIENAVTGHNFAKTSSIKTPLLRGVPHLVRPTLLLQSGVVTRQLVLVCGKFIVEKSLSVSANTPGKQLAQYTSAL